MSGASGDAEPGARPRAAAADDAEAQAASTAPRTERVQAASTAERVEAVEAVEAVERVEAAVASWLAEERRRGGAAAGAVGASAFYSSSAASGSGADSIVVGCSGGPDSTALLVALARVGAAPLVAVYVDHGLRDGTRAEAALVAANARDVGAASEVVSVEVSRRGNLLAAARDARYAALAAVARRRGAALVAVAHTATDQAETVAFRALRGDPLGALVGMPRRRSLSAAHDVTLVRPLLDVGRADTLAYVAARGIAVAHDPTNERLDLTRTRLRRVLLAAPSAEASLLALARAVDGMCAEWDALVDALGPFDALAAAAVAALPPAAALRLLRRAGAHRAGPLHARALLRLAAAPAAGSRALDLGGGLVAERRYDRIRLGPLRAEAADPGDRASAVTKPGTYPWLDGERVTVELLAGDAALALAERLPIGLLLRNHLPGDRLRTRAGRRKLHDVFIDRKLPRSDRRRVPLLAVGGDVLWAGAGIGFAAPQPLFTVELASSADAAPSRRAR